LISSQYLRNIIKISFSFITLYYILMSSIEVVEIRAIIHNSIKARTILMSENAIYQGNYAFNDYIYSDLNSNKNLNDEFFRIREYQITRWQQKSVVVVHKIRDQQAQNHQILFEKECDTLVQAQQHIPWHFSSRCSFFRHGWEYRLDNMRIFVEEIDGLPPSIEIIARSQEEVFNLFNKINIVNILIDSVPEWYCKSNEYGTSQTF
jgi:hypothetical protein